MPVTPHSDGRLADRAARVGGRGDRRDARGDRGGRAARASRRAPASRSHGILHRAVEAGLVRRAHGELVHVGLAERDHAGGVELLDHSGVIWRHEVVEHLRAAAGLDALRAEDVLVRERQTRQRAGACRRPKRTSRGLRLRQRRLGRDRDEGIERRLRGLDARQQALRELRHGKFFGSRASSRAPPASTCALS